MTAGGPVAEGVTTRCLIADDQAMVREGFAAVLATQPGLLVVGQASDGADAVRQTRHLYPDVVLMDVRMPVMDGMQATREILHAATGLTRPRVLMLTTFDLDDYVYQALRAGRQRIPVERRHRRRTSPGGPRGGRRRRAARPVGHPAAHRRLRPRPRPDPPFPATPGALTQRETEVLRLIARGLSNAEQTTKTHVGRILAKLDLRDRAQAVVLAYETGLVTPGGSAPARANPGTGPHQ